MWQTIKEIAKEMGMSESTALRLANKMVEQGEWEYRFRKEPNHYPKEYRRKIKRK